MNMNMNPNLRFFLIAFLFFNQNVHATIYSTCDPGSPVITTAFSDPGSYSLLICGTDGHTRGFSRWEISELYTKTFNTSPPLKKEERKKRETDWLAFMGVKKFSDVLPSIQKMEPHELFPWEDGNKETLLKLAELYDAHFGSEKKFTREQITGYDDKIIRTGYFTSVSKNCKSPATYDDVAAQCLCGNKKFSNYIDFACEGSSADQAQIKRKSENKSAAPAAAAASQ